VLRGSSNVLLLRIDFNEVLIVLYGGFDTLQLTPLHLSGGSLVFRGAIVLPIHCFYSLDWVSFTQNFTMGAWQK
jgi:hypothetical protein